MSTCVSRAFEKRVDVLEGDTREREREREKKKKKKKKKKKIEKEVGGVRRWGGMES